MVGLGAHAQLRLLHLDEVSDLGFLADFCAGAEAGIGAYFGPLRDVGALDMAERADRDTVGDADAWSEDDIGRHHAVPPDNRIMREPLRLRTDHPHPASHGPAAPPPSPPAPAHRPHP